MRYHVSSFLKLLLIEVVLIWTTLYTVGSFYKYRNIYVNKKIDKLLNYYKDTKFASGEQIPLITGSSYPLNSFG